MGKTMGCLSVQAWVSIHLGELQGFMLVLIHGSGFAAPLPTQRFVCGWQMLGCLKLHFSICANQRLVQDRMRIFSTIAKQVRLSGRLGWFDPSSVDIRHLGFLAETCMCKVIGPRDLEFSHIYIYIYIYALIIYILYTMFYPLDPAPAPPNPAFSPPGWQDPGEVGMLSLLWKPP